MSGVTSSVVPSKPSTVFIGGDEYVLKGTVAIKANEKLIGFSDRTEEVKTVIRRVEVFMTTPIYDFVESLPSNQFKASNGFRIICGSSYRDQLKTEYLFMAPSTFRNKKVDLVSCFGETGIAPFVDIIKTALKELVVAYNNRSTVVADEMDKMESL